LPKLDGCQIDLPNCWSCSERETNYVYALPPVENLHQELFSVIYFFFQHPTCLETTIPTANRVPIFRHWRLFFSKLSKIVKSFTKLLKEYFKHFCQKIKYDNSIWQTAGDNLTWRQQKLALKIV
jgi:hypothetical protein